MTEVHSVSFNFLSVGLTFLPLSLFSYIDFRFCEHCMSPIKMYYSMSSRSVMASCGDCDWGGGGSGGGGIHSYGSIRYCGCLCRTLIIFCITHWMFAGFQWIGWCAIRCLYHRCSIRMIMMIRTTIFQWMCKLRVGWNRLTLFVVLEKFVQKSKLKTSDSKSFHMAWIDLISVLTGCLLVTALKHEPHKRTGVKRRSSGNAAQNSEQSAQKICPHDL